MKLILLRGLPGAGKSTFARFLFCSIVNLQHIEADQYFTDRNGNYNYDSFKIKEAHKFCQERTKLYLSDGSNVVVSNTSTKESEIRVYQEIAEAYGAEFISLIVENRHGNSSVHSVPDHVMINMKNRFVLAL